MAFATDLKKYLPAAQRNSTSLNEFLDAVGELLDGFKTAIDAVQEYSDFQLIEEKNLDDLAKQFDIDFPRNMSVERKREYLREIVTLYRSKGTTNSVKRIFRLIGWDVDIDEYWIVNPAWYAQPTDTYVLTNETGQSVNLGLYDTIIGNVKTYKNDKIYIDLVDPSGNVYPKKQIYGEPYLVDEDTDFVKVPYIRINVKSEDFDLFTADYTQDGNIYSYDSGEEFEILTSIKDYMLDRIRPATVAIIEISTPFLISDTITYTIIENAGLARYTGSSKLTFNEFSNPQTINRADGSWIDDNFNNESVISIADHADYDGSYKVLNVTAGNLTLYREQPLLKNPQLITAGDFDNSLSGWGATNATLSLSGNTIHVESVANGVSNAYQQITTVAGETYEFSAELVSNASIEDAYLYVGTTAGAQDVGYKLVDFTLIKDFGWDIATASASGGSGSVVGQDGLAEAILFNDDGTKLYYLGDGNNRVFQYSLSPAYDVTSVSYDSVSLLLTTQEVDPRGMSWNDDGTKLFICGNADAVFQYNLGTAYDIGSAGYSGISYSVSGQTLNPQAVEFDSTGMKMYILSNANNRVYQYTLSAPWDISAPSYDGAGADYAVTLIGGIQSVRFSGDGIKMYIVDDGAGVEQYTLGTPWVVSTATYDSVTAASPGGSNYDVAFNPNGTIMAILNQSSAIVYPYTLTTSAEHVATHGTYSTTFISPQTNLYVSLESSSSQLAEQSFGWDNISTKLSKNLLGNGEFNSDIQWTKGSGWTVANGVASHTGSSSDLSQTINLTVGQAYKYTVVVSDLTIQYFQPKFAGGSAVYGERIYSDGTYSGILVATAGNTLFSIAAASTSDGSVDSITLVESEEILMNGSFVNNLDHWVDNSTGTGSIAWNAGVIDITSVDVSNKGSAYQLITTVVNQSYRITYTSLNANLPSVRVGTGIGYSDLGFDNGAPIATRFFDFIATGTTTYVTLDGTITAATASLDDISVVEIDNLVKNGQFIEDLFWTKGTGWAIPVVSDTYAEKTAGTASFLTQNINLVSGKRYFIQYTVSNYSAGTIQMNIQGTSGTPRTADGTYTETLESVVNSGDVEFSADSAFSGRIDNVMVTEVPIIEDYYFNNRTSNVGAKYDGTITYGTTTDRYIMGESMGGFKYGTNDMTYYGIGEDASAEAIPRTYTNNGTNVDQPLVAIRKNSEVVFEIDHASEIVSVYGVTNDRFSVAAGDPLNTVTLVTNNNTIGKHSVDVTGYYFVFVRTTFDAGQEIKVTYNLF